MLIISIDPGGVTGLAIHKVLPEKRTSTPELKTFDYDSDLNDGSIYVDALLTEQHHLELYDMLNNLKPDQILCEDFIYQVRYVAGSNQAVALEIISREYIGVCKLYSQVTATPLKMRRPAEGFDFWDDKKLKSLGLYTSGGKHTNGAPDKNAAVRHLLDDVVRASKRFDYLQKLKS